MKFYFDKRKLLILCLIFVLISISYLNYVVNNKSLLQTSAEFQNFEERQLALHGMGEEIIVIDSKSSLAEGILNASNENILENIFKDNEKDSFFLNAKLDMEVEREKAMERFDEIINNEYVDEESRKIAVEKKIELIETINKERIIESLIKGKGFEDAIVFITENCIYVTVDKENLTSPDIAKILDIVSRETGFSIEQIRIQEK